MSDSTFTISLRIWHPVYESSTIALAIGMQVQFAQSVGEPRTNPVGKLLGGINKESYCSFLLKEKVQGYFVDGIVDLLPSLEASKGYFNDLRASGGRLELYVGVFTNQASGFTLDTDNMLSLTDLGLNLSVEFYF